MLSVVFRLCLLLLITLINTPARAAGLAERMKAAGTQQLSHRAVYKLTLSPKHQSNEISSVDGRMVMEWRETCDGFISEQRIVTNTYDDSGSKSISDISASSWESLDGAKYRFSMRQRQDSELVQEYEGSAALSFPGGAGVANIHKPKPKKIKLPAGIIFSSGHMHALLTAARAGKHTDSKALFDGTSDSDYYQVVTSIGAMSSKASQDKTKSEAPPSTDQLSVNQAIGKLPWWPVQTSYYGLGVTEGVPEIEIAFKLYDNGVGADVTLDYGELVLFGELTKIEAYEPPDC